MELDNTAVASLAEIVAARLLGRPVLRAEVEPKLDWVGDPAFHVRLVLPGTGWPIQGRTANQIASDLQDELLDRGEQRFAFVHYATEEELADLGSEP